MHRETRDRGKKRTHVNDPKTGTVSLKLLKCKPPTPQPSARSPSWLAPPGSLRVEREPFKGHRFPGSIKGSRILIPDKPDPVTYLIYLV